MNRNVHYSQDLSLHVKADTRVHCEMDPKQTLNFVITIQVRLQPNEAIELN